jgi:protein-tyrosine-phosphatase
MAEAIGRTIGGDHMEFSSAGVDAEAPDPEAVKFLTAMSIDVSGHQPTNLGSLDSIKQYKAVVALGAEAADALPRLGYRTIALEWDVANPATDQETSYEEVFNVLVERVTNLIHSLHGTTSSALEEVTNK